MNPSPLPNLKSLTPNYDSYHPPLDFHCSDPTFHNSSENHNPIIYNFHSYDFNALSNFLTNLDFLSTFKNLNLVNAVDKFYEIIFHSFDMHIPKTRLKPNSTQDILCRITVLV